MLLGFRLLVRAIGFRESKAGFRHMSGFGSSFGSAMSRRLVIICLHIATVSSATFSDMLPTNEPRNAVYCQFLCSLSPEALSPNNMSLSVTFGYLGCRRYFGAFGFGVFGVSGL